MGLAQGLLIALIGLYRYTLSYFLGGRCRFSPSCSEYGLEAVRQHGALRGFFLIICRIGRCHPWSEGGWDPAPCFCESARKGSMKL